MLFKGKKFIASGYIIASMPALQAVIPNLPTVRQA